MSVQLVFLVDTELNDDTESATLLTNSICLSCIRLLSHLSSHFDKNGVTRKSKQSVQKLKWGFKFFNSKTNHTRIESHKLYDFKLRCFEHFENGLQKRLKQNVDRKTELTSKKFKPVDSLNKAFTEILADFKWEHQDFWSPVKGKKFRPEARASGHFVVLFTKCPRTFLQLKEFSGKRVLDEEIFLNSLFPNTLFEQFCKIAKLNLYWIDTQSSSTIGDNTDLHALEIVRKSLEKTGGGVTSLQALGGNGSPYFTNVQSLLEKEAGNQNESICQSSQCFQLLPLATVAKSFTFPADNKVQKVQRAQEDKCIAIQIENKTLDLLITRQNIAAQMTKSQKKSSATEKDNDDTFLQSALLQGYAILNKSLLGCRFPILNSYLCSEKVKTDSGKTKTGYVEGLLKKVNQELVTRNALLVLVCIKTGQLALMEPLTSHTVTLSLLSVDSTLSIEKQLLLQATFKHTASDTDHNKQKFVNNMVGKLVGSVHVGKGNDVGEHVDGKSLDGMQLDRHVVPGRSKSVQTLITKLNERISELDFLSSDEVATLKQLSKSYRKAKQPPGLRDSSMVANTETTIEALDKAGVSQKGGKTSHVSLSRTDKILSKSKQMAQDNKQKKTVDSTGSKLERDKPELAAHLADFQTEEELKNYLTSTYQRAASGEVTDIDSCTQSMVTVSLHYFELKMEKTCAKESCKKLLLETLLVSGNQLREKYSQNEQLPLEQKIAEYETQILLHMEVMSTVEEKEKNEEDQNVDEIVGMLRTLSFISEPGLLSKFMQSSLLHNYMHTIPRTLGNIYDELMQPLPESLANILSPEDASLNQSGLNDESFLSEDGPGPPSARTRSHGSVGPQSNQSVKMDTSLNTSRGGRKLVHHYSMVDFGSKRQIVVDKLPGPKTEKNAKKKLKHSAKKRTNDKALKSPHGKKRDGVKLQRRQSVAVMERTHKTPKKNANAKTAVTPSGRKGRLVAETPCHKQVSSMLNKSLQLQELQMDVIKESPEKACDLSYNHSPTKGKRAKALLRRSFYSAGPTKRTKNLSQYFQLANRIAGRQRPPSPERKKLAKLISFDAPEQFKSPDKNSSFLLSQLGASPSPAKVTPRKFTKTPSKIVDSPCRNTRSKCESPNAGLLGRRSILASPVSRSSQRPSSRKQSPRILAAESGVKKGPSAGHTTPEKSPAIGVVTFGLDSPSQNTRQKHSQTPTRKSVRAALFAKSPVALNHSPFRATASPRTLLDKFGSPVKTSRTVGSPVKAMMDVKSSPKMNRTASPLRNEMSHSLRMGKSSLLSEVSNFSNKLNADINVSDEKHSAGTKTPSPKAKKVTKTPDSFDKWRRMKPRMSQPSPSKKIHNKTSVINQENSDIFEDIISNQSKHTTAENQSRKSNLIDQSKTSLVQNQSETNEVKGSYRKKRSLLQSPEKSVGSFSKRRRTGHDSFVGSQGFDVTGSFIDLSQKSIDGSVDYFSASNDEVFASQDENTDMEVEEYSVENRNVASRKRHLFTNDSESQRSDSPIFGIKSGKASVVQGFPDDFEMSQKNSRVRRDSGNRSPACLLKSPGNKKYSPSVSAKSLMHLIQSPLLKSPESDVGKKSSKLTSPHSKAMRSRRSLMLNN